MTLAPEQTEVIFGNHPLRAGLQEPADGIAWVRRDARLVDHRDNSVAFEQLGVEVPAAWSQNATNILAQKYFRGPLGTPEREWSLRQVVGRVEKVVLRGEPVFDGERILAAPGSGEVLFQHTSKGRAT